MQKVVQPVATQAATCDLAGKAAIVTGSTSGIGLGIARAFAEAGMHVMLNGFGDASEIDATRAEIERATGVGTAYSAADMSKPADIARMVEDARRAFGQVDVLVNNAGTARRGDRDVPGREVGRHHRHQPQLGLPRH